MSGLPIYKTEKKEKIMETSPQFSEKEIANPTHNVTDVAFSVNKPITIHGIAVCVSISQSYSYKLTILNQGNNVYFPAWDSVYSSCVPGRYLM